MLAREEGVSRSSRSQLLLLLHQFLEPRLFIKQRKVLRPHELVSDTRQIQEFWFDLKRPLQQFERILVLLAVDDLSLAANLVANCRNGRGNAGLADQLGLPPEPHTLVRVLPI